MSPSDRKRRSIAQCIINSIKAASLQETLAIVGSDGTAAMTGIYSGAYVAYKIFVKDQFSGLCLQHCYKLSLRHLFQALDVSAVSHYAFSGLIAQSLK